LFFSGAALALASALAPAAWAQGVTLDLPQVLQAARQNPDAQAARRAAEAARADVRAADRAPAPTLSAGVSSIDLQRGTGTGSYWSSRRLDKSLGLDWTWERGNKRGLRTEAAEHSAQAAQADSQDMQVLQQIGALGAYYDLLAGQERLQAMQALADSAQALARSAELRLKAGDISAQDAARTRIESERARADLQAAQLAQQQATLALAGWIGQSAPAQGWQAGGLWPLAQATSAPDIEALLEQRPDVVAARARLAAAQAAVQGAEALNRADPTLGATFDHYPGADRTDRLLALRLSIPLNAGARFEGEIGRTLAQAQQAQDLLDKARVQGRAELQALWQATQAQTARLQTYDAQILPQAQRVAAQAELAFAKGGLPLTDLLDARRTLKATQLEALSVRTDHAKAVGAWQLRSTPTEPR
jgi:cobalt-zinc-cadmium efflux system outer membrane protein